MAEHPGVEHFPPDRRTWCGSNSSSNRSLCECAAVGVHFTQAPAALVPTIPLLGDGRSEAAANRPFDLRADGVGTVGGQHLWLASFARSARAATIISSRLVWFFTGDRWRRGSLGGFGGWRRDRRSFGDWETSSGAAFEVSIGPRKRCRCAIRGSKEFLSLTPALLAASSGNGDAFDCCKIRGAGEYSEDCALETGCGEPGSLSTSVATVASRRTK